MAILFGWALIYAAFNIGYSVFFDRPEYWRQSRRTKDFYRQFFIFDWWIDFIKGIPEIEIGFSIFFTVILLVFGILLIYVGFQGPINVNWK
jgi:hypothetical protein